MLKYIFTVIFISIYFLTFSIGQEPITPTNSTKLLNKTYAKPPIVPADDPVCTEDCTGLKFVQEKVEYIVNCEKQTNGTSPFCNQKTNECDSDVNACLTPDPLCQLGEGFYPHLNSSSQFYYCNEQHSTTEFMCISDNYYNPETKRCEYNMANFTFSPEDLCKGNIGTMMNHPTIDNYFIYCGSRPILFICRASNFTFNPAIGRCDFSCPATGKFPDPREGMEAWYFKCTLNGTSLIQSHKECQNGQVFDPHALLCVFPESKMCPEEFYWHIEDRVCRHMFYDAEYEIYL